MQASCDAAGEKLIVGEKRRALSLVHQCRALRHLWPGADRDENATAGSLFPRQSSCAKMLLRRRPRRQTAVPLRPAWARILRHEVDRRQTLPGGRHTFETAALNAFVASGDQRADSHAGRRLVSLRRNPVLEGSRPQTGRYPCPATSRRPVRCLTAHGDSHGNGDRIRPLRTNLHIRWRRSTDTASPPPIGRSKEGLFNPLINLLARAADLALVGSRSCRALDEIIDGARRDAPKCGPPGSRAVEGFLAPFRPRLQNDGK